MTEEIGGAAGHHLPTAPAPMNNPNPATPTQQDRGDRQPNADRRERRARALALASLDTAGAESTVAPEDVRQAAALWRRCPHIDLAPGSDCTRSGVDAWAAATAHLGRLGHDTRWCVPDRVRRAWHQQRGRCGGTSERTG